MTATPSPPRPRGGRRPGAGAPRGNTNALKNGVHSPRLRAIATALYDNPHYHAVESAIVRAGATTEHARTIALVAVLALTHKYRLTAGLAGADADGLPLLTPAQLHLLNRALGGSVIQPLVALASRRERKAKPTAGPLSVDAEGRAEV